MLRVLATLPRTVWIIGLMSLLNDCASEMVYPLIPLYLASVLMAGPQVLGLIEGFADMMASLLKLFSGFVVDRSRRSKPWILAGYGLASIGRPLIPFVTSWPWLLFIRVTDRIGKGLRTTPRDAVLARSVSHHHRGLVFGLHRALDNGGAVLGPLLASLLLASDMSVTSIFYLSAIPALLCLALAGALTEPPTVQVREARSDSLLEGRWRDMPKSLKRYLVVVGVFTLGKSSTLFLLLRAQEVGISQAKIPLLWAGVSAVAAFLSTPISALSDRMGRTHLLCAGYSLYGLFYVSMACIGDRALVLISLFVLYGVFLAATEGTERALVADIAPQALEGTAFGWFNMVSGVTLLPASLLFGFLYEKWAPQAAFVFSAACALLSVVLLILWVPRKNTAAST